MANGQERCLKYYRKAWYSPDKPLDNQFGKQFPNQKLPTAQRIELYRRWVNGESTAELSEQYGLSITRVRAIVGHFKKVYGER